jgi:hypothetical protein
MRNTRIFVGILVFSLLASMTGMAQTTAAVNVELTIGGLRITLPAEAVTATLQPVGDPIGTWEGRIDGILFYGSEPFTASATGSSYLLMPSTETALANYLNIALNDGVAEPTYGDLSAGSLGLESFGAGDFSRNLLFRQDVTEGDDPGTYTGTITLQVTAVP